MIPFSGISSTTKPEGAASLDGPSKCLVCLVSPAPPTTEPTGLQRLVGPTSAILIPALFAGGVAIAVTVAVERWGGRIGGLLGTLPSTIVPAAVGILSESSDPEAFRVAMYATPLGMLVNAAFLWTWRALPPRLPARSLRVRLALMVIASLLTWAVAARAALALLSSVQEAGFAAGAVGAGGLGLLVGAGALACLRNPPSPKGRNRVGLATLAARGVLAGVAIAVAVLFARYGGPVAAGLASTFPAIFLTTMVSLWLSQGEAVQAGAVGPMMLGSGSVAAFALFAAWTMPALGPALGAAVAWVLAAGLVTVPAWWWLGRRPSSPPPLEQT